MRHLLSIQDLGADGIEEILDLTDRFVEVSNRAIPRVPALRGRTVASLFFENSTRTRLSFETAAKRLSADTMTFTVASSSVAKGESIRDTVETIGALGADCVIVRHKSSGVPVQITHWTDAAVVNAGDGWHEHPTQALLDAYTVRSHLGSVSGRRVVIVGDVKHSRVARSNIWALSALGAEVVLVAPPTLLPPDVSGWPVRVSHELDRELDGADVVYLLRMQLERQEQALVPTLREYGTHFGLTPERAARLSPAALLMHPGPMNRGIEISAAATELKSNVILDQVSNGVAVRMAVLYLILGSGLGLPSLSDESERELENTL